MIGRERVNPGLDIGEILLEKDGHIRVEAFAVGYWRIGMGMRSHFVTFSSPRGLS